MTDETSPQSPTPNPLLMEEIPQTVGEMVARIEKLFHCVEGPPMAYFEIPLQTRAYLIHRETWEDGDDFERLVYVALAWRGTRSTSEAGFVGAMFEAFLDARVQLDVRFPMEQGLKPLLFWRRKPGITEYKDVPSGVKWPTLRCRVVIPGATLARYATPEGEPIPRL